MGKNLIRRLDEDRVLQAFKDDQFRSLHRLVNLLVQARIAAAIQRAGDDLRRRRDLMKPWRHFGFGVNVEDVQEHLRVGVHNLLLAPSDHLWMRGTEIVGEPARRQRIKNRPNALFPHRRNDRPDLLAILFGSERSS